MDSAFATTFFSDGSYMVVDLISGQVTRLPHRHGGEEKPVGVYAVEVAVAQGRPPKVDAHIWYSIEATGGTDAELTALQWAAMDPCTVMPVSAVVLDWEDGAP